MTTTARSTAVRSSAASAAPTSRPASRAAQRALDRRRRRQQQAGLARVAGAGRPVRSALLRVPFVIALIVVLGVGIGGVLYLNTKTDASGVRTEQARAAATQLRLDIEALGRNIAEENATPRIADKAHALGLVPAGDAAILVVGADGSSKLIGKPAPAKAGSSSGGSAGGGSAAGDPAGGHR